MSFWQKVKDWFKDDDEYVTIGEDEKVNEEGGVDEEKKEQDD